MSGLNPITDIYHSQLEASRRFAEVFFSGTERIDHVVLEATHRAFTEQLNLAHAAVAIRDPKEIVHLQSNMLSHRPDGAVNFQKEMMRVFAEIQNEMGKSMKEYVERFGSSVARSATAPLKSVQDRTTDTVFNPMTGIFSIWESAFREVAALANKNLTAARAGYEDVAEEMTQQSAKVSASAAEHTAEAVQQVMAHARETQNGRHDQNGAQAQPVDASEPNEMSNDLSSDIIASANASENARSARTAEAEAEAEESREEVVREPRRTTHHATSRRK
jgi:hypothetical protein